ncbi:MAG: hypothetical protein LC663_01655 [Actinobacteria bacterium]|nr:hypothetical protein [Actinomycetota bacterium]
MGFRRNFVALGAALALVGSATPTGVAQTTRSWRAQVADLLQRRGSAVVAGDRGAFDASMARAPAAFRAAKDTWFARVRELPLASYSIELDDEGYEDLVSALPRRPVADEVHAVQAIQHLALRGLDDRPSSDALYLTVARYGSTWSIVSDSDLDDLGLQSARDIGDFAPISIVRSGGVMVLTHGSTSVARTIANGVRAAIAYDRAHWPYRVPDSAVVEIPRSSSELTRILSDPIDLGPFVAFTVSSADTHAATFRLVGTRIFIQPETYFANPPSYQRDTLSHEMIHYASHMLTGEFGPAWTDEGIAQLYGERGSHPTSELRAAVRRGLDSLPIDADFSVGGRDSIHVAYEAAYTFMTYLRARFGSAAPARFYRALGAENPVSFGSARYHADHAARAVFALPFDSLERGWIAMLRKELG